MHTVRTHATVRDMMHCRLTTHCHSIIGSIGRLLAAQTVGEHVRKHAQLRGALQSIARLPVELAILQRRRRWASESRGRLLNVRGKRRYCEHSRSRRVVLAGADKVHACRLQTDRGHAALAPPARRRHSPCLPGVVSIPGGEQSSLGGQAGRSSIDRPRRFCQCDYYCFFLSSPRESQPGPTATQDAPPHFTPALGPAPSGGEWHELRCKK